MANPSTPILTADGGLGRALVAWFGLYQLTHVLVNVRGIPLLATGRLDFPAPPPAATWSTEVVSFLMGMAVADTINALASLVYVVGHFGKKPWRHWLGTVTLSIAVYAAAVLAWATISTGAWAANPVPYVFINVMFLPMVALFVFVCAWSIRSRSSR